jgi:hypothetical protein
MISDQLSTDYALDRDNEKFYHQDWDNGTFDIQNWLRRTPWHSLKDTVYGCKPNVPPPNPVLWEDPLLMSIYKLDIATFLTAERVSMVNISKMVSIAPDENSQVFLATQALDEARHYEVFCRRLADFGMTPQQRDDLMIKVQTPAMENFYNLINEQVDKQDMVAALLAHNIILEGMAYPVYRYEIKYWSKLDRGLSQIIQGAFADEVHHVGFGEAIIEHNSKPGTASRNKILKLSKEFHSLMKDVFEGVINHYIGLYQEAANNHMDIMGDIEIFPGYKMAGLSEEAQVRMLLQEIQNEHNKRLQRIGLA